ncbi:hypothetical protein HDE69_001029 [Pedobacter cryoconitis]|uniref:Uncharacterized protein n=1 Tax=Pedobacter cryoconitis TaxID=188932 RepID=A0A7W8YQK5_9SPHI|nr:hypothetical protein [Pedobacter cryoconitis]MBB5619991.1 hypothetical protein [Pedobacter cryoconitis]MBB5648134.1 hypothetical protein [Pedobacter cryoconitis]
MLVFKVREGCVVAGGGDRDCYLLKEKRIFIVRWKRVFDEPYNRQL